MPTPLYWNLRSLKVKALDSNISYSWMGLIMFMMFRCQSKNSDECQHGTFPSRTLHYDKMTFSIYSVVLILWLIGVRTSHLTNRMNGWMIGDTWKCLKSKAFCCSIFILKQTSSFINNLSLILSTSRWNMHEYPNQMHICSCRTFSTWVIISLWK